MTEYHSKNLIRKVNEKIIEQYLVKNINVINEKVLMI